MCPFWNLTPCPSKGLCTALLKSPQQARWNYFLGGVLDIGSGACSTIQHGSRLVRITG